MAKESKNRILKIKHLRRGLAILLTPRSPYWLIRLWDPIAKKYVSKSSKETSRREAAEVAYEFFDSYRSKANSDHAKTTATSFEHYAKKLMAIQKGQSTWSEGDNKLLNRSKDGLIVYFGKYDVAKITTGMVRDYLTIGPEHFSGAGSLGGKHGCGMSYRKKADIDGNVFTVVEKEDHAQQEKDVVIARDHVFGPEIHKGNEFHAPKSVEYSPRLLR